VHSPTGKRLKTMDDQAQEPVSKCLQGSNWLTATVINDILCSIASGLADGTVMAIDSALTTDKRAMARHPAHLSKIATGEHDRLLLPIHKNGHWILVILNRSDTRLDLYDSLDPVQQSDPAYFAHIERLIAIPLHGDTWTWEKPRCTQQRDSNSCGVAVLMFALFAITGIHLPETVDWVMWRRLFAVFHDAITDTDDAKLVLDCLRREHLQEYDIAKYTVLVSPDIPEPGPSGMVCIKEALRRREDQLERVQAEIATLKRHQDLVYQDLTKRKRQLPAHISGAQQVWAALSEKCQSGVRTRAGDLESRRIQLRNRLQALGILQEFESPIVGVLKTEVSDLQQQVEHYEKDLAKADRVHKATTAVCEELTRIDQELCVA